MRKILASSKLKLGLPLVLNFMAFVFLPSAASPQGDPLGPEFRVNTYTTSYQGNPAVSSIPSGNFVVVWMSYEDGSFGGIFGQRYSQIVPVERTSRWSRQTAERGVTCGSVPRAASPGRGGGAAARAAWGRGRWP